MQIVEFYNSLLLILIKSLSFTITLFPNSYKYLIPLPKSLKFIKQSQNFLIQIEKKNMEQLHKNRFHI